MTSRAEHIDWAKERALEIVSKGQWLGGWISMVSDLQKHEETKDHIAVELGNRLLIAGHINNEATMRKFIEGFN